MTAPNGSNLAFSATNYILATNGTLAALNAPTTGPLELSIGGTPYLSLTTSTSTFITPIITFPATISPIISLTPYVSDTAVNTVSLEGQGARSVIAISTCGVVNGSPSVSTTTNETAIVGPSSPIIFTAQPTTVYYVSSVNPTTITLTGNYLGPTNAATGAKTLTYIEGQLAGTFNTQNGSPSVATTSSQVAALAAGYGITFGNQPGVVYVVSTVVAATVTLTTNFTGTTDTTNTAVLSDQ